MQLRRRAVDTDAVQEEHAHQGEEREIGTRENRKQYEREPAPPLIDWCFTSIGRLRAARVWPNQQYSSSRMRYPGSLDSGGMLSHALVEGLRDSEVRMACW